jgi:hypothetical protein
LSFIASRGRCGLRFSGGKLGIPKLYSEKCVLDSSSSGHFVPPRFWDSWNPSPRVVGVLVSRTAAWITGSLKNRRIDRIIHIRMNEFRNPTSSFDFISLRSL